MGRFGAESTGEEVADAFSGHIKGKTVLITGATRGGLGAEVARLIYLHEPALLILAGRRLSTLEETARDVRASAPSVSAPVRQLELDLGSLAKVRRAAAEVNGYAEGIDVLINNAGTFQADYRSTDDGIEATLATNHLGPFLFTNLIMPRVLAAGPGARVVNVGSMAYQMGGMRFDDYNFDEGRSYDRWLAYGQSKTATILSSLALAQRLRPHGLLAFSLHPGGVVTNLTDLLPPEDLTRMGFVDADGNRQRPTAPGFKDLSQGCSTHLVAAFDPSIADMNGAYLDDCNVVDWHDMPAHATSKADAERLWKLSEELVGQTFNL